MMLKQTARSPDRNSVFDLGDANAAVRLGSFRDIIFAHDIENTLAFEQEWELDGPLTIRDPRSGHRFTGDRLYFRGSARQAPGRSRLVQSEGFAYRLDSRHGQNLQSRSLATSGVRIAGDLMPKTTSWLEISGERGSFRGRFSSTGSRAKRPSTTRTLLFCPSWSWPLRDSSIGSAISGRLEVRRSASTLGQEPFLKTWVGGVKAPCRRSSPPGIAVSIGNAARLGQLSPKLWLSGSSRWAHRIVRSDGDRAGQRGV